MQLQFCHLSTCYLHVGAFNRQDKEMCIAYYVHVRNGGPRSSTSILTTTASIPWPINKPKAVNLDGFLLAKF